MTAIYSLCVMTILFLKVWAATVLQSPVSMSRAPGEWAEFTCSVACSHSIDWYVEGYSGDITNACSAIVDGMMVCRETTQSCSSTSSTNGGYTEILRVLAKPELASTSIAVQCAAISLNPLLSNNACPPNLAYSRYALLTVTEAPTPTAAPTEPLPSPSPVVCPTASQDVSVITVTSTVTATVTVTPEPDLVMSRGTNPGTHLGRVLTELLTWGVTVLAGIIVM